MEAKAQARYVRVTPMKARRVINEIRGMNAAEALDVLEYAPQGLLATFARSSKAQSLTPAMKAIRPESVSTTAN